MTFRQGVWRLSFGAGLLVVAWAAEAWPPALWGQSGAKDDHVRGLTLGGIDMVCVEVRLDVEALESKVLESETLERAVELSLRRNRIPYVWKREWDSQMIAMLDDEPENNPPENDYIVCDATLSVAVLTLQLENVDRAHLFYMTDLNLFQRVEVENRKNTGGVFPPQSRASLFAVTWSAANTASFGVHGESGFQERIRSNIMDMVDEFALDWLRANPGDSE